MLIGSAGVVGLSTTGESSALVVSGWASIVGRKSLDNLGGSREGSPDDETIIMSG